MIEYVLRDRNILGVDDTEYNKIDIVPIIRVNKPSVNLAMKQGNIIIMAINLGEAQIVLGLWRLLSLILVDYEITH